MACVIQIVEKYLSENGYDGLYNEGDCACLNGDLAPCGEIGGGCEAGYLQSDSPADGFIIGKVKQEAK